MLTGAQVATAAYETEDGELLSPREFDQGDVFARPVSRYELDERQSELAQMAEEDGAFDEDGHVDGCEFEPALYSDGGDELLPFYHYKGHGCTFDDDTAEVEAREQRLYGRL